MAKHARTAQHKKGGATKRKSRQRAERPPSHVTKTPSGETQQGVTPSKNALAVAERRELVYRYRVSGASLESIRDVLRDQHGIAVSVTTVWEDEQAEIQARRDRTKPLVEQFIVLANDRMERLILALWPYAIGAPATPGGLPMPPDYGAQDRILRLIDRQARLLGADKQPAPTDGRGDVVNFNTFLMQADERFKQQQLPPASAPTDTQPVIDVQPVQKASGE